MSGQQNKASRIKQHFCADGISVQRVIETGCSDPVFFIGIYRKPRAGRAPRYVHGLAGTLRGTRVPCRYSLDIHSVITY